MNITKIIELLPDSVKSNIIDFQDVKMKSGGNGTRVVLDRVLTDIEKHKMKNNHIIGIDCIAVNKYAPELKRSYFYIV